MQHGRGFTECLMCGKEDNLMIGNVLGLKIIQNRYDTNEYDIMLQNTKICAKCIGRLHQINDFCASMEIVSQKKSIINGVMDKKCCDYCGIECSDYEFVPNIQSKIAYEEMQCTKWAKSLKSASEYSCCYSCFNFIISYNNTKEILKYSHEYYYNAIDCWHVKVRNCYQDNINVENVEQIDSSNLSGKQEFFDTLSLVPASSSVNKTSRHVSFSDDLCTFIPSSLSSRRRLLRNSGRMNKTLDDHYDDLKKKFNIMECEVVLKLLNIGNYKENSGNDLANNKPKRNIKKKRNGLTYRKPVKKPVKIKLNSKSKAIKRMSRKKNVLILKKAKIGIASNKDNNNSEKDANAMEKIEIIISEDEEISSVASDTTHSADEEAADLVFADSQPTLNASQNSNVTLAELQEENNNSKTIENSNENMEISVNEQAKNKITKEKTKALVASTPVVRLTRRSFEENVLRRAAIIENSAKNISRKPTNKKNISSRKKLPKTRKSLSSNKSTRTTKNLKPRLGKAPDENVIKKEKIIPNVPAKQEEQEIFPETEFYEELSFEKDCINNDESLVSESTEIEFLHPRYKNKAVRFEHKTTYEEVDILTFNDNFLLSPMSLIENCNSNYFEEDSLEILMNSRISPLQDTECPIYTMDELRNEDSLIITP